MCLTTVDLSLGLALVITWTTGIIEDEALLVSLTFGTSTFFLLDVLYRSFSRLKDQFWAAIWTIVILATFLVHSLSFVPKVLGLQEPMLVTLVTILMFMLVLSATIIIHSESMNFDSDELNSHYPRQTLAITQDEDPLGCMTFQSFEVVDLETGAGQDLREPMSPRVCAICMCDISIGETAGRLMCGHIYHASCIGPWLSQSPAHGCPMRCSQTANKKKLSEVSAQDRQGPAVARTPSTVSRAARESLQSLERSSVVAPTSSSFEM